MSRKRMLYPKEKAWAGLPIVGGPCQSLGISAATEDCLRTATKHCDAHKKPNISNLKLMKHCNAEEIQKLTRICFRPGHRCQSLGMLGI